MSSFNRPQLSFLFSILAMLQSQKYCTILLFFFLFFSVIGRLAFPEPNNSSLKKIAKLEDPADYSRLGLVVRSYCLMVGAKFLILFSALTIPLYSSAKESRPGHESAC